MAAEQTRPAQERPAPVPDAAASSERATPDREGVVDLLGALACGELSAFERMAADARLAPTLSDKSSLAGMAAAEFGHYQRLCAYLRQMGVEPEDAMAPYVEPLERFHDLTAPADWLESLVKAYVGDGIARDFYREISTYLDPPTRSLVQEVLGDTGQAAFAVERVGAAIAADPSVAGRLALWARRLVGEALTQAQRVALEREGLVRLVATSAGDLAELGEMFRRVTDAHAERMKSLGLSG